MRRIFLLTLLSLSVAANLIAQNFNWGLNAGNINQDFGRRVVTDPSNNVYSLVMYNNTLTIDSAGTPKTISSYGNRDIAVIKYNCNKVFQWAIKIGGPGADGGASLHGGLGIDTSGNVYIHTSITGSVNITSANGSNQTRNSAGGYDALLIKASNAGMVSWITQQGGLGANDEAGGLDIDRNQNVYITGQFSNNANFTQTAGGPQNRTSLGSTDAYIAKYNSAGVLQYVNSGGSNNADMGISIAVDSAGSAYIVGSYGCCANSFANFGSFINNTGGIGAFVSKANAAGTWQWATSAGSNNNEIFTDIEVDDINDKVYTIGRFDGATTLTSRPPGINININVIGAYDLMMVCYTMNGSLDWARTTGGSGNESGWGVTVDLDGNPVFSGEISGSTNFGGTTLVPNTLSTCGFVAKYSPNNTLISAVKLGSGSRAGAYDVHYSSNGLLYATGYFTDSLIAGNDTLRSAGNDDFFMVRLSDHDTTLIQASNTNLSCTGDSANLYVMNKEHGSFTWFRNDTLLTASAGYTIQTSLPGTYKAVSNNTCAPPDTSATIVITKSAYYTLPPLSDIFICTGDSGRLYASGGSTFLWTPATGLSNANIANPIVKPLANTTYYLRVTEGTCVALDTIIVNIQTNCCLTCSSPYQLNQGVVACYPFTGNMRDESGYGNNAVAFNAFLTQDRFNVNNRAYQFNGFTSYLEVPNSSSLQSPNGNLSFTFWARVANWTVNAGVQFNPILSKSVTAASGQYRALIRSNGAYAMANSQSFNGVIGSNTNLNTWYFFAITVSNDTMYYYRNGILLGYATGPTPYLLNNTTPLRIGRNDINSTSYFNGRLDELRIYDRTLNSAEVLALFNLSNINGLPTINAGTDKSICNADSVQLVSTGSIGTYLWTPSIYLNNDTAKSPYCKPDSSKTYIARVDVSGCRNYDTVTVNVSILNPSAGLDQVICKGDTAMLTVQSGGITFNWSPNYRISTLNNDTTKVFPLVDTNYVITTSNGTCTRKDTVRVSLIVPTVNAGIDQNVCLNDTAHFTVSTNGTVRWSPLTYLSDSVGTNLYSVPDSNITYYLTANYLGCIARDTISVSVATIPIDAGPNTLLCMGDSVQLHATGATLYIWIPNYRIDDTSSANPWVKPMTPTYYYVISYNLLCSRYDSVFVDVKQAQANAGPDKNICNGDSVQINGSVLGPYTWSPAASLSDTSLQPYAKPLVTTNYILSVNNFGCRAYDTVAVNVTNFNISAGADKSICKGDSVQLFATGGTVYNWLPVYNISDPGIAVPWVKPLGPTKYFLISTNGICTRTDTVFVDVKEVLGSAGKDTGVCEGGNVMLNATGGVSYLWMNTYALSNPNIANPVSTPLVDTTYVVKIMDAGTCFIFDSVRVNVDLLPVVNAGIDQKHCPGEFVTLNGSINNYTYFEWTPATGLNDKLLMQPLASVTSLTNYVLLAYNGYCFNSDTAVVDVNPPVKAIFTATPDNGIAPLPVTFINKSKNAYFYDWSFGELGATSTDSDPSYTFNNEGVYTVLLTARDSLGCLDTSSTTVTVTIKENIFAPSAFSPNGDGLNDLFAFIYSPSRFEFLEVSIFNRWGVKVYETKMPGGAWWDGKINGVSEPPGIFTYYAVAKDKKGKSFELTGTVAIIR